MKEILAVIPARGGSKSIKRKNIRPILGRPMIYYSIDACKKSKYITRFVVSTEDDQIAEISQSFGAEVIKRPMELAQDETKTAPVMLHVANSLETQGYRPDYITLIQPTSPFRDYKFIDNAFDFLFSKSDCDSCFSGVAQWFTHAKWKELHDGSLEALYDYRIRPRRQDVGMHYRMFCENGAFYTVKYDIFKKVKDFIGENPCIYLSDFSFDIDEEEDFSKAEEIMKNLKFSV